MEEFKKDDNNFIYEDENGVYTFLDMGDYITARRSPLDSAPTIYRLMIFNGKGNDIDIRASIWQNGSYQQLLITKNSRDAVVLLQDGRIVNNVSPEVRKLAVGFLNASNNLTPKLREYLKANVNQRTN